MKTIPTPDWLSLQMRLEEAVVPCLWWFEVRNILVVNERRGRITESDTAAFLLSLSRLRVRLDRLPEADAVLRLPGRTGYPYMMPLIWNWRSGRAYVWRRLTRIFEEQRPRQG